MENKAAYTGDGGEKLPEQLGNSLRKWASLKKDLVHHVPREFGAYKPDLPSGSVNGTEIESHWTIREPINLD